MGETLRRSVDASGAGLDPRGIRPVTTPRDGRPNSSSPSKSSIRGSVAVVRAIERARWRVMKMSWVLGLLGESAGMDSVLANFRRDVVPEGVVELADLDSEGNSVSCRLSSVGVVDRRLDGLVGGSFCRHACSTGFGFAIPLIRGRGALAGDVGGLDETKMGSIRPGAGAVASGLLLLGNSELAIDHGFIVESGGAVFALLDLFLEMVGCLLCTDGIRAGFEGGILITVGSGCFCGGEERISRGLRLRSTKVDLFI